MFIKSLSKRLNQLGAEMVEYAIVLACIAAVGVAFYSTDGNLAQILGSTFNKVVAVVDGSSTNRNLLGDLNLAKGSSNDLTSDRICVNKGTRMHSDIFNIEPNSQYEIQVDLSKLTKVPEGDSLMVGFFVTDEDGKTNMNNSGWINTLTSGKRNDQIGQYVSTIDGNIAKITFDTGANSKLFGMNFRTDKQSGSITTDESFWQEINSAVSLYKK